MTTPDPKYRLTEEEKKALRAPFPKSVTKVIKDGPNKGKTAIDAVAKLERLNEVFGEGGWKYECLEQFERTSEGGRCPMVVVKASLHVGNFRDPRDGEPGPVWQDRIPPIVHFGSMKVVLDEWGSAYKGALTAAVCRAARQIGVGIDNARGGRGEDPAAEPPRAKQGQPAPPEQPEAPAADESPRDLVSKAVTNGLATIDDCRTWLRVVKKYTGEKVLQAPEEDLKLLASFIARNPKAFKEAVAKMTGNGGAS